MNLITCAVLASAMFLLTGCGSISCVSDFRVKRAAIVDALIEEQHYNEALASVDRALLLDWTYHEWYRLRSEINAGRKAWSEAVADANTAHWYEPSSSKYWMVEQRASVHEAEGNISAAIDDCSQCLAELRSEDHQYDPKYDPV